MESLKSATRSSWSFLTNHRTTAGVLVGAGVTVVAAPFALAAAGFGAGGIVAGSVAAGVQSAVYGGATCGLFATATSAGAAGFSTITTVVVAASGALAGGKIGSKL